MKPTSNAINPMHTAVAAATCMSCHEYQYKWMGVSIKTRDGALRGLALRVLELPTMSLGLRVPIPGDVRRVQLGFAAQPELKVTDVAGTNTTWRLLPSGLAANPVLSSDQPANIYVILEKNFAAGKDDIDPESIKDGMEYCIAAEIATR